MATTAEERLRWLINAIEYALKSVKENRLGPYGALEHIESELQDIQEQAFDDEIEASVTVNARD